MPRAAPLALALLLLAAPAAGLTATRVTDALTFPVYAASPPGDSRLFVVEVAGTIRILDPGTGAVEPSPFLDLRDRVDTEGEGGLLGLAFDPDFAENGRLYLYYTADGPDGDHPLTSRLSRFTADPPFSTTSSADPSDEEILFSLDQPRANHNGATVAFGPEGRLYLGLGDGGGAGDPDDRAQDDATLLGKLLRFDVSTPLPPLPLDPEVVAKGLRNPYRFAFDPATGDLYLGDVGQDALEEIDVLPAESLDADFEGGAPPLNLGWNVLEGTDCFDPDPGEPACDDEGLIPPIHVYPHANVPRCSASVTGGRVYRGSAIPSLVGAYVFGDFCMARIWTLRWDGAGGTLPPGVVERTQELVPDAGAIDRLLGFAEDDAGELYMVDVDGELFRIPEPGTGLQAVAAVAALGALARHRAA